MTITLELTPEQEARLEQKARTVGVDPVAFLISKIDQPDTDTRPKSGREIVEKLLSEGVIGAGFGGPDLDGLDAPQAARALRAKVWRTKSPEHPE